MPKLKPSVTVVGIDPSIGAAAVNVNGTDSSLFSAGEPCKTLHGRMCRWQKHRDAILGAIPLYADLIVLEGYSYASNGRSILDLAEFGGLLRQALTLTFGYRVLEVPPTTLKKFITGKGNANKAEMVAAIARRCAKEYKTEDEYEAHGLWMLGNALIHPQYATNNVQREIIKELNQQRELKDAQS